MSDAKSGISIIREGLVDLIGAFRTQAELYRNAAQEREQEAAKLARLITVLDFETDAVKEDDK